MCQWTAKAQVNATPEQVLDVLTHPDEIRRWSPVEFRAGNLEGSRLAAGTRTRVTGRLAGLSVGFDVEVHSADVARFELSADGPLALDVRYNLTAAGSGAELTACVDVRRARGLTGRLVASATETLLAAGALDSATGRIAAAAEVGLTSLR